MSSKTIRNTIFGLFVVLLVTSSTFSTSSLEVVLKQPLLTPHPTALATSLILSFSPGDNGTKAHHHSGPAVGYILEGSYLFQADNETPRIIPTGGTFYLKDRSIHVWSANALEDKPCRVLATVFGRPGEELLTFSKEDPRKSRKETLALIKSKQ